MCIRDSTYTPLAFVPPGLGWGAAMAVAIWLLALYGIGRELWWACLLYTSRCV